MFRLDDDRVIDATMSGGMARYINHSCDPNCVAETVSVEQDLHIIIITREQINKGEEVNITLIFRVSKTEENPF